MRQETLHSQPEQIFRGTEKKAAQHSASLYGEPVDTQVIYIYGPERRGQSSTLTDRVVKAERAQNQWRAVALCEERRQLVVWPLIYSHTLGYWRFLGHLMNNGP